MKPNSGITIRSNVLIYFVLAMMLFATHVKAQDRQSPEKFVTAWTRAFTKNDAKELLSFYEPSDELDVRMSSGVRYKGYKQLKDIYETDMGEVTFLESVAKKMDVRKLDDIAIVTFEHQYSFKVKRDGVKVAAHIQTVMVLNRTKTSWQIVNEHSSPLNDIPRFKEVD